MVRVEGKECLPLTCHIIKAYRGLQLVFSFHHPRTNRIFAIRLGRTRLQYWDFSGETLMTVSWSDQDFIAGDSKNL